MDKDTDEKVESDNFYQDYEEYADDEAESYDEIIDN